MARRVSPGLLLGLVDPYARDLPEPGADADVERDGEPRRRCAEYVGRQPAQERRDACEGARGTNDETAVARIVGVGWKDGGDGEGNAADEGEGCGVDAAGVEMVGGPGYEDLNDCFRRVSLCGRYNVG